MDSPERPTSVDSTSPRQTADGASAGESRELLEQLLDADADLERAFERLLTRASTRSGTSVQAVVPGHALDPEGGALAGLLESIVAEYEDIDRLLSSLREAELPTSAAGGGESTVAYVTPRELADPEALAQAVAPSGSEQLRLETLFAKARHGLARLDVYNLCQRTPESVLSVVEQERNLRTVQSLVEFLRALNQAADTFESLDLPQPHIRDYLRHLYTMKDWEEMGRLVRLIEGAVEDFSFGVDDPDYQEVVVSQEAPGAQAEQIEVETEPVIDGSGEHEARSLDELVDQLEEELTERPA